MKKTLLAAVIAIAPMSAWAQAPQPAAPQAPAKLDMIVVPREVLADLVRQFQAIGTLSPELMKPAAVQALQQIVACANDNPVDGRQVRQGPDQCVPVTEALQARAAEIAGLQKEVADAKAAADKAAKEAADKKAPISAK